ncbi:hypothetical protein P8631_11340 [Guyparkeria sp. 1SP6A2]|nr:hypothetical protein [Guyparkeria sp. 1SP6A2]
MCRTPVDPTEEAQNERGIGVLHGDRRLGMGRFKPDHKQRDDERDQPGVAGQAGVEGSGLLKASGHGGSS